MFEELCVLPFWNIKNLVLYILLSCGYAIGEVKWPFSSWKYCVHNEKFWYDMQHLIFIILGVCSSEVLDDIIFITITTFISKMIHYIWLFAKWVCDLMEWNLFDISVSNVSGYILQEFGSSQLGQFSIIHMFQPYFIPKINHLNTLICLVALFTYDHDFLFAMIYAAHIATNKPEHLEHQLLCHPSYYSDLLHCSMRQNSIRDKEYESPHFYVPNINLYKLKCY